jgi:hypothetical protein
MTRIIVFLLIIFFPLSVFAEEHKGYYFFMRKGDTAPYEGILFDKQATAKVLGQAKLCGDECALKLKFQEDDLSLVFQRDIQILNIKLIQKDNTHKKQLDLKDQQIKELQAIALNSGFDWGSFAVGAGAGALIISAVVLGVIIATGN